MTPTRRGFMGSLVALGATLAAPVVQPASIQEPTAKKQKHGNGSSEMKSCMVEFITRENGTHKMPSKYSVVLTRGRGTVHVNIGKVYFHGTIIGAKLSGVNVLPDDFQLDLTRERYVNFLDSVSLDFQFDLTMENA